MAHSAAPLRLRQDTRCAGGLRPVLTDCPLPPPPGYGASGAMTTNHRSAADAERLFREHHIRLVAQLRRHLDVPNDLAEDACARAWEQLLRYEPAGEEVIGWLYTVAKHEAFTMIARRNRETPLEELAQRPAGDLEAVVEARRTLHLLGELNPRQRQVLRLRAQGHSYASICQATGHTYTWVNRHMTEGRRALRRRMDGR